MASRPVLSIPEPKRCSLAQCKRNIRRKLRIGIAMRCAATNREKAKLRLVQQLLEDWIVSKYNKSANAALWRPRKVQYDEPVGYGVKKRNGLNKFGMSFNGTRRTNKQDHTGAYLLMGVDDMVEFVPEDVVNEVKSFELPGLIFEDDHTIHLDTLIRMQLCEAYFATVYKCTTDTICERFMQLPSPKARDALSIPPPFSDEAIEFMEDIPDNGIFCVFSWKTLPSAPQDMKANSPFLQQKLPDLPPKGGFVKLNRAIELFGSKFGRFEDAVKRCPREEHLDCVIEFLERATTEEDYVEALEFIRGTNYSHYIRPSDEELAFGAVSVLEDAMESLPENHVIVIERVSFEAIENEWHEWIDDNIDMDTAIYVMSQSIHNLTLVRAKNGRRIIITLSFFTMFAENVSKQHIFQCVKHFIRYTISFGRARTSVNPKYVGSMIFSYLS